MNTPTNLTNWYFEEVKKNIRLAGRSFEHWDLLPVTVPGRVGRKDFARFLLCHFSLIIVLVAALGFITGAAGAAFEYSHETADWTPSVTIWNTSIITLTSHFLFYAIMAYMFLTLLGACIRRLHDAGRSGLWVFLGVLYLPLFLLILFLFGTQPGKNKYDSDVDALRATSS